MNYEKGIRTKQHIYETAKSLMYTFGYKGATIKSISTQANVPVGLVNYYYKKIDILTEIYYNFVASIYACIEEQLGDRVENTLQKHIILNIVVFNRIFSDEQERRLYFEVLQDNLYPEKVHNLVQEKYGHVVWEEFGIHMTFDKFYLLNWAEFGARYELLQKCVVMKKTDPIYKEFVNVAATIAIRLAGVDSAIISYNVEKAYHLLDLLDTSGIVFLK